MKQLNLYRYFGTLFFISIGFSFNQISLLASCKNNNCLPEKNIFLKKNKNISKEFFIHKKYKNYFKDKDKLVLNKLLANLFLATENAKKQKDTVNKDIVIDSDIQYFEGDIFYAEGNVLITLPSGNIKADKISYDRENKKFIAENNVIFEKGNQYIQANFARFNLKTSNGLLSDVYGALDFANIGKDLNIVSINKVDNFCEGEDINLIKSPSEVSLIGSSNVRFKNKIGIDAFQFNFSKIDKWRFKSNEIILKNRKLNSELIYFTNDPYNDPQFILRSKDFSAEIIKDKTRFKSKRTQIIFDDRVSLPIGNRTIDNNSVDLRWGIGYESKDKDGLFIIRNFDPIEITNNLEIDFQPYFLLQRSLLGETNNFRAKNSSVLSENVNTKINFLDYFALNNTIKGKFIKWNLNLNTSLKTINPERFYDGFSYDLNLLKNLYKKNRINNKLSSECPSIKSLTNKREQFNVDLGIYSAFDKDNIYKALGSKLISSYQYTDKKLEKNYLITLDIGTFQGESKSDENYLTSLDRYGFTTTIENNFKLFNNENNPNSITSDYNYSPEIINPGIKIKSKVGLGFFEYSNNSSQSTISLSAGSEFTYGDFKNKFLDYTVFSVVPEYKFKNGESPFKFDDFGNSSRILFEIKQQIYGPLIINFMTSYNINSDSNNYGKFENNKLTVGVSRRAYSFGLAYDEDQKSVGIEFKVFNFGYNKNSTKF